MRRLLQLIALLAGVCGVGAAACSNTSYANGFTCVQAAGTANGGAGSSAVATFGANTTVGNVVVFFMSACADAGCTTNNAPSMTFSQSNGGSNSCTQVPGGAFDTAQDATQSSLSTKTTAYVCPITSAGTTFTATVTGGTPFYLTAYASEWSGVATTNFFDQVAMGISPDASAVTSTVTTASTANTTDLVIGYIGTSEDTITPGSGFSEVQKPGSFNEVEAKSVASKAAQSCTWSHAAGSTQGLCLTLKSSTPDATSLVSPRKRMVFKPGATLPPYVYVSNGDPLVGVDTTLVGFNNPNMPTPPSASGGFVPNGTIKTFSSCTPGDDSAAVLALWSTLANGDALLMSCVAGVGSGGLTLSGKTNVKIYGAGSGGFKALAVTGIGSSGGFSRPGFVKLVCTDCLMYNLDFNVNNIATGGLLVDSSTRTEIRHVSVHDGACVLQDPNNCFGTSGITGDGNTGNRYIDNHVYSMGGAGPNVNGLRGSWLRETGPLIWGSTFENNGGTGSACNCSNAEWGYNYMSGNQAAGIKLSGAGGPANDNVGSSSIHHNLFDNSTQIRLENTATSTAFLIYHNELRNQSDGIYANGGPMTNTQVTHNYIHDIAGPAVKLLSSASSWVIQDNEFYSNAAGVQFGEVGGTYSSITINRNDIKGNVYGVKFLNTPSITVGTTITNNAFTQGNYGLNIDSGTGGTITQSGNCWQTNAVANVSDGRGIISNPASNGPCANPVQ